MANKTLIVIGGGAAGFFCAVNAARLHTGLQVIILEKSSKLLSKVKVSGGGRCNVTHGGLDLPELIKKYPRGKNFLKKIFHQFSPIDTVRWFEDRAVKLKTEPDGRMFPVTDRSQTIIDCLLDEATKYKVRIELNAGVDSISKENDMFHIQTSGKTWQADYVCIACGGFPKYEQFNWLRQLGHTIEKPVPSLFTFNIPQHPVAQLMGVSVPHATVRVIGSRLQASGPLLITHWGLSGPVVLKLSAWGARELSERNYQFDIMVNWLGEKNEQELRNEWPQLRVQHAAKTIETHNPFGLPNRLWNFLMTASDIDPKTNWSELRATSQNKLIQLLTSHTFHVSGKTTFKEEFVTCGGVALTEIGANTMQSRKVPRLYFAGEIIDVDGITGGFNFQNAWTTGWVAAQLKE